MSDEDKASRKKSPRRKSSSPDATCSETKKPREELCVTDTAPQKESATKSKESPPDIRGDNTAAELPIGEFFRLHFYKDGSASFEFDGRQHQHPATPQELSAMVGTCHIALWQLVEYANRRLGEVSKLEKVLDEMLKSMPVKGSVN